MNTLLNFLALTLILGYAVSYDRYRGKVCEIAGCEDADVEACHILPQVDYPELADGQGGTNIITLCRFHHVTLSHYGNTSRYYNTNLREVVRLMNEGKRTYKKWENKQ